MKDIPLLIQKKDIPMGVPVDLGHQGKPLLPGEKAMVTRACNRITAEISEA